MLLKIPSPVFLIIIFSCVNLSVAQFYARFSSKYDLYVWMINESTVRFNVIVPSNHYFSIGYGKTMTSCDMVIWQANGANSKVQDLFSYGHSDPAVDSQQNYVSTFTYNSTHVNFISDRALNTGDSKDFTITLNTLINMNYAFVTNTYQLVEHTRANWGNFQMKLTYVAPTTTPTTNTTSNTTSKNQTFNSNSTSTNHTTNSSSNSSTNTSTTNPNKFPTDFPAGYDAGGIIDLRAELEAFDILYVHGWVLWVAWGLQGFLQIASTRYLKIFPKINLWVHIINGCLMTLLTFIFSLLAFRYYDWNVRPGLHSILGFIMLVASGAVVIVGFISWRMMINIKWRTDRLLKIKLFHQVTGYAIIIVSQVTILLGVMKYSLNDDPENPKFQLGIAHFVIFFIVWLAIEMIYQTLQRRIIPYESKKFDNVIITLDEFKFRVKSGDQLVILDDMVLDVRPYLYNHPGGAFVVQHNIGRDISKYFYGGYQLENFTGSNKSQHSHSMLAVAQVNRLIIAKLDREANEFLATISVKDEVIRKQTYTVNFLMEYPVEKVHKYYSKISMIGQHFLVYQIDHPHKKRHYTICNCLSKEVYEEYIRVIDAFLNRSEEVRFHEMFLNHEDAQELCLTIKNYMIRDGLSKRITECTNGEQYQIKGPMGKGLDIQPTDTHIAFAAGTGVLVFLDLVAHLIRKNLGLLSTTEDKQIVLNNFKFVLYVSFPTKTDVIGYKLCRGLQKIVEKLKRNNFEYHIRLANDQVHCRKWDLNFIEKTLNNYDSKFAKIWVCGPPKMNEAFDLALKKLSFKYEIDPSVIEIF